jgi:hypothetical protein
MGVLFVLQINFLTISLKNHHGRLISYVGEVFICQVLDTHLGTGAKDGQND